MTKTPTKTPIRADKEGLYLVKRHNNLEEIEVYLHPIMGLCFWDECDETISVENPGHIPSWWLDGDIVEYLGNLK